MLTFMLLLHFSLCLFLTGLIWIVQVLHYPSFNFVEKNGYKQFSAFHVSRISYVVIPTMLTELASGIYLTFFSECCSLLHINLIVLIFIWLSTFFLSVPLHNRLSTGHCSQTIQRLVLTNWPRTIGWSLRSLLLFHQIFFLIQNSK